MDHARALVVDGERRVKDLETSSKQLENDFYAQSDGFRRDGVIKPAWDKARDDLEKARVELDGGPQVPGRPLRGGASLEHAARLAALTAC